MSASDDYGVARRRVPGAGAPVPTVGEVVIVSCDVALLLLTLREAGPLPEFVCRQPGWEREVARLVADGLLEVEWNGNFVSGAAAGSLLWPAAASASAHPATCTRLAALSRDAAVYAAALLLEDERAIAECLYVYNREPLTPAWARKLGTKAAVAAYLGLDGAASDALRRYWVPRDGPACDGGSWRVWNARGRRAAAGAAYKLYISPRTADLPEVVRPALAALAMTAATSCKIGDDAGGILRPDKFVAYFDSFGALASGAERVRAALDGALPQGVPFTSEIAGDGLLSWGMDPPANVHRESSTGASGESWRDWVTVRLARYLAAGRRTDMTEPTADDAAATSVPDHDSVAFAFERLRLDGVDTDSWTPSLSIWIEQVTEAM